jgi:hypothetical protein
MPRDLFAENGINPTAQNSGPVDLFQQNNINPYAGNAAPQQSAPLYQRIVPDIVSGLATAGQGLHNFLLSGFPSAQTHIDFGKEVFGVNQPNLADNLIQGGAQYAPYAAAQEVAAPAKALSLVQKLLSDSAAGGIFGTTQSDDPVKGGVAGALTAPAGRAAGELIPKAPGAILDNLSQYSAKGMAKNVGESLSNVKDLTNAQAFDLAKNNYQNYTAKEKGAWDALSQEAAKADEQGAKFDNKPYVDSLVSQLEKLRQQSGRQSGFARANTDSISMLGDYMKDQHGTFTDAIEHNKALNQDYQNEITPGKSLPFTTVNYAKSNIKQAIGSNLSDNNLQNTLGNVWDSANKITSEKNQLFNQVVSPGGREQISKFSTFLNGKNDYQDPSAFVKDYVPSSRGDGIQKMEQFSKMLGDDQKAKDILKMNYFGDVFDSGNNINASKFINKYKHLSNEQQGYMFSADENKTIQGLSRILDKNPQALNNTSIFSGSHLIPLVLGGAGGYHFGGGAGTGVGALAALSGVQAGKVGLEKLLGTKPAVNYFANRLAKAPQAPSPSPVISPILGSLLSKLAAPQAANYFGGQQ